MLVQDSLIHGGLIKQQRQRAREEWSFELEERSRFILLHWNLLSFSRLTADVLFKEYSFLFLFVTPELSDISTPQFDIIYFAKAIDDSSRVLHGVPAARSFWLSFVTESSSSMLVIAHLSKLINRVSNHRSSERTLSSERSTGGHWTDAS